MSKRTRWVMVGFGIVMVVVLLSAIGSIVFSKKASATDVVREPIHTNTANPFTAAVGTDKPYTPPKNAGGTYSASTPGLYGGTKVKGSCDSKKLVAFLQQNPSKAAAWAGAIGIQPAQIPAYVASLTSVILRSDTAVTNHGYFQGKATAFQSVLQAGTAVLVDKYGTPVTKCYCGNPLGKPQSYSKPKYTGPSWSSFSQTDITIIQQSNVVINSYRFVNIYTKNTYVYKPTYPPYPYPYPNAPQVTTTLPSDSGSSAPLPSDSGSSAPLPSDSAGSLNPLDTLNQNWANLPATDQQTICDNANSQGANTAAANFLARYPVQGITQADLAQFLTDKCPAPAPSDLVSPPSSGLVSPASPPSSDLVSS